MPKILSRLRYHIAVFFAVIGPGFITAVVDNDSGGIFTYSAAGAKYGYLPLWTLLPITVALIIAQEMCSRMGAVTGKGLSDLIREEFGLRITFVTMTLLVLVNMTNVMSEFARIEVVVGCFMTSVIAFFIIVACAGAIYSVKPRDIQDAKEAALGLKPYGQYAFLLFSAGLFNASIFAASILPLSTAYSVCEGLGFESGVNRRLREAPIFYFLYTALIVVGAGVVLAPRFPLVKMILWSQVL